MFKDVKSFYGGSHMPHGVSPLFAFAMVKCIFCFSFPEHLNNTFETTLSCILVLHELLCWSSNDSNGIWELFETIFDSFHSLTIVTKISILDVAGVFDPTVITNIFASQCWILINWKPFFPLYRNRSINSNAREDGWDGNK